MAIECGSQITICDLPIRFDTYKGCSHACAYCFVKRKSNIADISPNNCIQGLKNFIEGKRTKKTLWCDWDIPLHWGGLSDPFQPCEKQHRISLHALELLAKTKYPFIVSTKGRMICDSQYLAVLKQCDGMVQVSMACDKYDVLEKGCPPFAERLEMVKMLSKNCRRVIIRIQPYLLEVFHDVLANIPKFAEAGAYGITIEGMKFLDKKKGTVKFGGDYVYSEALLKSDFEKIKKECHRVGIKFYCAENRLRHMGDSMTCCGADGMGWRVNDFNLCHLTHGEKVFATGRMKNIGTAAVFSDIGQTTADCERCAKCSFETAMLYELEKYLKRK